MGGPATGLFVSCGGCLFSRTKQTNQIPEFESQLPTHDLQHAAFTARSIKAPACKLARLTRLPLASAGGLVDDLVGAPRPRDFEGNLPSQFSAAVGEQLSKIRDCTSPSQLDQARVFSVAGNRTLGFHVVAFGLFSLFSLPLVPSANADCLPDCSLYSSCNTLDMLPN